MNIPQDELREEMKKSKQIGKATNQLQEMFYKIIENIGRKKCFRGYTYLDDMKQEAYILVMRKWQKIDEDDHNRSVFSYLTTMIERVFIGYISKENKRNENRYRLSTDKNGEYRNKDDNEYKYIKYEKKIKKHRSKRKKQIEKNIDAIVYFLDTLKEE